MSESLTVAGVISWLIDHHLDHATIARIMEVSVRDIQDWEAGRCGTFNARRHHRRLNMLYQTMGELDKRFGNLAASKLSTLSGSHSRRTIIDYIRQDDQDALDDVLAMIRMGYGRD